MVLNVQIYLVDGDDDIVAKKPAKLRSLNVKKGK